MSRAPDIDAICRALSISWASSVEERTVDITTTGRQTGKPRRIETWFHRVENAIYLSGQPGPRSWFANLQANPRLFLHLKNGVAADLSAQAVPVVRGPERERVLSAIVTGLGNPASPPLASWIRASPLVRLEFDDQRIHPFQSEREG